jgi:hypothetical protein
LRMGGFWGESMFYIPAVLLSHFDTGVAWRAAVVALALAPTSFAAAEQSVCNQVSNQLRTRGGSLVARIGGSGPGDGLWRGVLSRRLIIVGVQVQVQVVVGCWGYGGEGMVVVGAIWGEVLVDVRDAVGDGSEAAVGAVVEGMGMVVIVAGCATHEVVDHASYYYYSTTSTIVAVGRRLVADESLTRLDLT